MNKALLSIGTNEDREVNMALCHKFLDSIFSDISYSKTSLTEPYGTKYKSDFLNQLAVIYTTHTQKEVSLSLKEIERKMGRKDNDKEKGIVKIDIDLVIWNEEVLKPTDISRAYITNLLPSLTD
ncbi:MAG: 2-amino-4-hydroxy-6-hydroxymethyldihydropteridine diphosphokinase [Prevotella sp.]|jgi:2-amino-4-hydroxy-6-hydroxymethyldihydropteridine diphosphokinase|nr:2-amino-4-hydroxy-6-hydroxymethyldihydropteridine diphosphokinase [Prevotella sp.]